jgi:hypothetical protein
MEVLVKWTVKEEKTWEPIAALKDTIALARFRTRESIKNEFSHCEMEPG